MPEIVAKVNMPYSKADAVVEFSGVDGILSPIRVMPVPTNIIDRPMIEMM